MAKKQSKNKPCACGSGKKYKRCCGKPESAIIVPGQDQPLDSAVTKAITRKEGDLKNEIRDPFAGISEEELVQRDLKVQLANTEVAYECSQIDKQYFKKMVGLFSDLRTHIAVGPDCPLKANSLKTIDHQLAEFSVKLAQQAFNRTNIVILIALRKLVGPKEEQLKLEKDATEQAADVQSDETTEKGKVEAAGPEGEKSVEERKKDRHGNPVLKKNQNPGQDGNISAEGSSADPKEWEGDTSAGCNITQQPGEAPPE